MTKRIVILDDSALHQEVARRVLGDHRSVVVPRTLQEIRNVQCDNDVLLVLVDRVMPDVWREACWDLIDRCPKAKVVEWTTLGSLDYDEQRLASVIGERHPRINWVIDKTGCGQELIDAIHKSIPMRRVKPTPPYFDDRDSAVFESLPERFQQTVRVP